MKRSRTKTKAKKAKAKKVVRGAEARAARPPRSAEEREDRLLAAEARKALADPENRERVPWEQLRKELGL
jgi:hypothetical protein